ncbi:hypothetical protein MMC29_007974 [Sticta canariensis]|nr:hypothetical protein [Sticta canariensis]
MDEKLYKRVPGLIFNCDDVPEICTNMCWGAYCTEPTFGATLYYDKPDEPTKARRRTGAGCLPRPNRCSVGHNPPYPISDYNCDEYPFASTSDADNGGQVNRCVPKGQNSVSAAQGGIINGYYQNSCGGNPCSFIITFGNPGAAGGQNPDVRPPPPPSRKRGEPPVKRTGGLYETESGMQISSRDDLEPGTILMRVPPLAPRNSTLTDRDLDEGDGDEWDNDPVDPVVEVIKRKVR